MKKILLALFFMVLMCFPVKSQISFSEIIIRDVFLIDGNGGDPVQSSVFIKDGLIEKIGAFKDLTVSDDVVILNAKGKYLIPGLIDSHVHLQVAGSVEDQKNLLESMLLKGVTTVQDLVGDARDLAFLARLEKQNKIYGSEIHYAAMFTNIGFMQKDFRMAAFPDGKDGSLPFLQAVDEQTDFKEAIARAHATGASSIKLYANLSKNIIENLTREAHAKNMRVWSHAALFPLTSKDVIAADVDVICHAPLLAYNQNNVPKEYHEWFPNLYSSREHHILLFKEMNVTDQLKEMKKRNIILDATLAAFQQDEEILKLSAAITKEAHKLGVKVTTGTDIAGFPTHKELFNLVEHAGFTPKEALIASSKNGAEAIGILKTHGTIEEKKVANLILLDANPLEDIKNIEKIKYVCKRGMLFKP